MTGKKADKHLNMALGIIINFGLDYQLAVRSGGSGRTISLILSGSTSLRCVCVPAGSHFVHLLTNLAGQRPSVS
jgi:hypothetical protein